ncbi:hypothetical protein DNTS_028415 [Danionella cerebrum]|uniref:C2H2-type domain-containing protein n=1 Tax=Danionella cerebrum TaxID=2873325 RepID=A0A553NW41_9TELE|nr:hypothetical protein DNTS_028415 [Danionella translucida]
MGSEELRVQRWIRILSARALTEGSVLGPCAGADSAVAFIACSCSDRRAAEAGELRLDPGSSDYLQMIQSARNTEEQNLELYMKNGHLFFRAIKDIPENTELLAWYGEDLARLLGLSLKDDNNAKGLICSECKQSFLFEFPLLAHQRFFCSVKPTSFLNKFPIPEILSLSCRPTTDFHNIARELENCRKNRLKDAKNLKRRRSLESDTDESDCEPPSLDRDVKESVKRFCLNGVTSHSSSPSCKMTFSKCWSSQGSPSHGCNNTTGAPKSQENATATKSAFTLPPRITSQIQFTANVFPNIPVFSSTPHLHLKSSTLLFNHQSTNKSFISSSNLWLKSLHPQQPVLPRSASSIGLPMQNWCAKCNISFHLTSDLVQHMRSHHKRAQCDERLFRNRDERLKCPVCKEAFRERHHLSRHLTSHS